MTDITPRPAAPRRSPQAIRNATFTQRRRGFDQDEVRALLASVADELEAAHHDRAALRAELERLHEERQSSPGRAEINAHAVALFSQAQQVADRLVAEAVQHARDLMMSARAQQREILQQAHDAAEAAESAVRAAVPAQGSGGAPGYVTPIPEIEYVRTFARVAQVQLRSVLDALTEQVDKLGDIPQLSEGPPAPPPSGEVSWTATVPKAG